MCRSVCEVVRCLVLEVGLMRATAIQPRNIQLATRSLWIAEITARCSFVPPVLSISNPRKRKRQRHEAASIDGTPAPPFEVEPGV